MVGQRSGSWFWFWYWQSTHLLALCKSITAGNKLWCHVCNSISRKELLATRRLSKYCHFYTLCGFLDCWCSCTEFLVAYYDWKDMLKRWSSAKGKRPVYLVFPEHWHSFSSIGPQYSQKSYFCTNWGTFRLAQAPSVCCGLQPLPACQGAVASLSRSTLGASGEPRFHVEKRVCPS